MKILRKISAILTLCLMAGALQLSAAHREHVVRPGDTLYSLSKLYGVTVEAIQAANPVIEGTNIPTGMTLIIPDAVAVAEPKSSDKNQSSALIFSGAKKETAPQNGNSSKSSLLDVKFANKPVLPTYNVLGEGHWTDGTLTLAVIMPFNLNAKTADDQKTQMRSVEFYQGVLLAVDEIQQSGRRVSVMAFDLGTESMASILSNKNLLSADFIIGPMDEADLKPVADWGEEHGTPVVSPFAFSTSLLDKYDHLFQINTQKSLLYPQLSDDLFHRFKNYTFVFLTDSLNSKKPDPYATILKRELRTQGKSYKEMTFMNPERLMACDSLLGVMNEDVIFVPVTPQQTSMRRIFSGLQHVKILRDARHQEALISGNAFKTQPKMAILGYPEWVLYTGDFIDYFYDLNVYLFTKLYVNPFDPFVKRFYDNFKAWYNKEPMSLMPKYGILGYDISRFFLRSLSRHGQHIEERLVGQEEECLQNIFSFEKGEKGRGFYNHGLYLVHFTPESTIEKIVIK